jgi:hypothetical protein
VLNYGSIRGVINPAFKVRSMLRRLFSIVCALSLALSVATAMMWRRSTFSPNYRLLNSTTRSYLWISDEGRFALVAMDRLGNIPEIALNSTRLRQAQAGYVFAFGSSPPAQKIKQLRRIAMNLIKTGHYREAIAVVDQILLLDPMDDFALGVRPVLEDRVQFSLELQGRFDRRVTAHMTDPYDNSWLSRMDARKYISDFTYLRPTKTPDNRRLLGFCLEHSTCPTFSAVGAVMPCWAPFGLFLLLPTCAGLSYCCRKLRKQSGHCPACGYDLRATPVRCPECGKEVLDCDKSGQRVQELLW